MCPHEGRAHWCQPVNTTESSVCSGDAALCQITLTTCHDYYYFAFSALTLLVVGHREEQSAF